MVLFGSQRHRDYWAFVVPINRDSFQHLALCSTNVQFLSATGMIDLDIVTPAQPNLFAAWDQLLPVEIYLQLDPSSQLFMVPSVQSGFMYPYDAARPSIWIARIPQDPTWVGKESSIKIKIL